MDAMRPETGSEQVMSETWIPAEQLRAEVEQMLADCTPGDWQWGVGPHEDDGNAIEWFTKLLGGDIEARDIWTVWVEADDGEPGVLVPAITGNGPHSETHAKLIASMPNVLRLFLKLTASAPETVGVDWCNVHSGVRNEDELTCDMWNGDSDCDLVPLYKLGGAS